MSSGSGMMNSPPADEQSSCCDESLVDDRCTKCHVHCGHCHVILTVDVPHNLLDKNSVLVRCGDCRSLISVNIQSLAENQSGLVSRVRKNHEEGGERTNDESSIISSSDPFASSGKSLQSILSSPPAEAVKPPKPKRRNQSSRGDDSSILASRGKKPRTPSAYNMFVRDEILRIKAKDPTVSHKEAFIAAAKNWATQPHINLGTRSEHRDKKIEEKCLNRTV
uniref:Transcription factor YABBY n=1 Tax=Huperzia selago TaxID=70001 RepID=A0A286QXT2_HUPSE|nr:transcription factor YABBY [Huperzia selago]